MTPLTRRELTMLAAAAMGATASGPTGAQIRSGPGAKYKTLINSDLEDFPLQMTRVTLMEADPGTPIPQHYHPAAQEIAFAIDGALTLEVDGRSSKTIKAGDALVIPAGILHTPRAGGLGPTKVLFIHNITDKTKPFVMEVYGGDGPE